MTALEVFGGTVRARLLLGAACGLALTHQASAAAPEPASPAVLNVIPGRGGASGGIRAARGAILIDITAMPLAEAARRLAAATHATLQEPHALDESKVRLTLRWRGPPTAAWQQLLDGRVNHAAWCHARGCAVRMLSQPRPGLPGQAAFSAPPPASDLQPDPPGLFPADEAAKVQGG